MLFYVLRLRRYNWMHFAMAKLCCLIEFKLRYLELFSIRVKELFQSLVLLGKGDGR